MRVIQVIFILAVMLGAYWLDRQMLWLGHPVWQPWGILALVLGGVGLAALMPANAPWQGLLAGFAALAAGYLSWAGKADFVASYAEDALAGRYWFIGYHALMGLLAFALMRLASLASRK